MSKILAAVGGTGQEVALACLRLCHMAGVDPPRVFVFDSDTFDPSPDRKQVPTRSQALREIGELIALYRGANPIEFMKVVDREGPGETVVGIFSPANQTPREVDDILKLLLTPVQRGTRVIDGFHGQPTVGAITFADYVARDGLDTFLNGRRQNGKVISEGLEQLTEVEGEHYIIIAGGTAGGTGPGVIPVLARAISDWRKGRNQAEQVGLSILVQLPWFQITRGDPKEDINVEKMRSNSACLVRLYANDLGKLADRVVLLGLPGTVKRVSSGPHHQPEVRHYLNVLSGWLAGELLTRSQVMREMERPALYGFALDDERDMLTELGVTLDSATGFNSVPLRRAVDATRMLVAFGEGLLRQLKHPRDPALRRETWRLVRRIGERNLPLFTRVIETFAKGDADICRWFRAACDACAEGERGRDSEDEQRLFNISKDSEDAVNTDLPSVAKIRPGFEEREHDLVADLILKAKLLPTLAGEAPPGTKAARLYATLRPALVGQLLE